MNIEVPRPRLAFSVKTKSGFRELKTKCAVSNPQNKKEQIGDFVWDTGATITVLNKNRITDLKLIPTGFESVSTPNGVAEMGVTYVDIEFSRYAGVGVGAKKKRVILANLKNDILGLIGMDIISLGSFLVHRDPNTRQSSFQFCFPGLKKMSGIDFINLAGDENENIRKKIKQKLGLNHPILKKYPKKPKIKT